MNKCPYCNQNIPQEQKQTVDREKILFLIKAWKILNNLPLEGEQAKTWDRIYFPRLVKSAKHLIMLFEFENAVNCMEYVFNHMKRNNLDCTLETIVKRADLYQEQLAGRKS